MLAGVLFTLAGMCVLGAFFHELARSLSKQLDHIWGRLNQVEEQLEDLRQALADANRAKQ